MAEQGEGGIAWTDCTWNPIRGCSRVSEGCRNCYAEKVAARFSARGLPYEGLAKRTAGGARWTGKVRVVEEHLNAPLRWTRPRKVFVNSMSDLFHENLSDLDVLRVFDVMREAHDRGHTFQVLTKRAGRMRQFASQLNFDPGDLMGKPHRMFLEDRGLNRQGQPISFMPLMKDVWLGVSVEDQAAAQERIPELLATPAAVRWLSIEPQIGPVDLGLDRFVSDVVPYSSNGPRLSTDLGRVGKHIHWVVIGGESGPGARPFNVQWARDLVRQCQAAGVAVFVKQLGAVPVMAEGEWRAGPGGAAFEGKKLEPGWLLSASTRDRVPAGHVGLKFTSKGGDPAEWPSDLRVREYPEARR